MNISSNKEAKSHARRLGHSKERETFRDIESLFKQHKVTP